MFSFEITTNRAIPRNHKRKEKKKNIAQLFRNRARWWELHAARRWGWRKVLGPLRKIRYWSITFNNMATATGEHSPNKPVIILVHGLLSIDHMIKIYHAQVLVLEAKLYQVIKLT
jgi:hypothetical protein